jgi:hypothetical protein
MTDGGGNEGNLVRSSIAPLVVLGAALAAACATAPTGPDPAESAITAAGYSACIATLASDAFEGRKPGQAGEEKTLAYLERVDQLGGAGIARRGKPAGVRRLRHRRARVPLERLAGQLARARQGQRGLVRRHEHRIKTGVDSRDHPKGWVEDQVRDYIANRYHQPRDKYDPGWDVSGSVEDLRLLYAVGARVASESRWPTWYPSSEFGPVRERSRAAASR